MVKINQVYLKCNEYVFVDVRSPKEFEEDTIPGAFNIPLFLDDERAIIGKTYKQESKEKAIKLGVDFFSARLKEIFSQYSELSLKHKKSIVIFCWRGGMRSESIYSLLKSLGFNVMKLDGGYKDYRQFVREELQNVNLPNSLVLFGLTGSGKTEVIKQLNNGLDLEGLAQHRGSILGDVGLKVNSQKKFESLLLKRIYELKDEKYVVIECESRKIGKVQIPDVVFDKIKKPWKTVLLDKSLNERIDIIKRTYFKGINLFEIKEKLKFIEKHLGKEKLNKVNSLLDENKIDEFIKLMLAEYYDLHYERSFQEFDFIVKSDNELFNLLKKGI